MTQNLRARVESWNDDFIFVRQISRRAADNADGGESQMLKVVITPIHAYITTLLRQGVTLNIIDALERDRVITPQLIVVEPDYLVDISAIAACFEDYGPSPQAYLLRQLMPQPLSAAILMGNMAGQILDEALSLPPDGRSYVQTAQRFFEDNALALTITPVGPEFHDEAQRQAQNIARALTNDLPQRVSGYDASRVMLEPSFLSEMLGLQGRMDFLTTDHTVLIEQKAGTCGWPQRDPFTPVYAEKHYVQMLLYMLLLRYTFPADTPPAAFLLYSKYPNALLPLGYAPQLVYEAMRLRNEIVAAEFAYARKGIDFLASITPDDLNLRHRHGRLWNSYQRPKFEAVLAPIHSATALERAYFLRMLTFVHTEHLWQKVGDGTTSHGAAARWRCSLDEKKEEGSIIIGMKLERPEVTSISGTHVAELLFTLNYDDSSLCSQSSLHSSRGGAGDASDFRLGDIVVVYPYAPGNEPDVCRDVVFRATIVGLKADHIRVHLRAAEGNVRVFSESAHRPWAMEHDFMESSVSALNRGLHSLLTAPQPRRDLLLLQRRPQVDDSLRPVLDHGDFNDLAQRFVQARDLFLIIGPPGTGKTSFGLMTAVRETLARDAHSSLLLVAYTNRAVDEICSKLLTDGIDFLRVGGDAATAATSEMYSHLLSTRVKAARGIAAVRSLLTMTRVIVATTSAISAQPVLLKTKHFDLCVVDEASQILEPQLMTLWSATNADGRTTIDRFLLIGDHKQLPAVVCQPSTVSRVDDAQLRAIGLIDCRNSLFHRLLHRYANDPTVCYLLRRQGRMHPDIADFPNRCFYGGQLTDAGLSHQLRVSTTSRMTFIDVPTVEGEATIIAEAVLRAYQDAGSSFDATTTVGVIVPYRKQIAAVRSCLQSFHISALTDITIDTVERYQGSQRDTIIYGFTVSQAEQLDFLRATSFEEDGITIDPKLNVALTRAREYLIIIGNAAILSQEPLFARLIEHIKSYSSLK